MEMGGHRNLLEPEEAARLPAMRVKSQQCGESLIKNAPIRARVNESIEA